MSEKMTIEEALDGLQVCSMDCPQCLTRNETIRAAMREKDARIKELLAEVNCIHCGEPKQCWCGLRP